MKLKNPENISCESKSLRSFKFTKIQPHAPSPQNSLLLNFPIYFSSLFPIWRRCRVPIFGRDNLMWTNNPSSRGYECHNRGLADKLFNALFRSHGSCLIGWGQVPAIAVVCWSGNWLMLSSRELRAPKNAGIVSLSYRYHIFQPIRSLFSCSVINALCIFFKENIKCCTS